MSLVVDEDSNVNKKLSVYKHVKKKAANDAQLLMNRIALIQKEEERARKKIEQTKERAVEILALRNDTQKRVKAYKNANSEVKQLQQIMLAKNREQEEESKRVRAHRLDTMQKKKKSEVIDMLMEKKYLTQMMIHEQEKDIQMKQKRRMEIRKMEEEAKAKKEAERLEREAKIKEFYERKLVEEANEAKRAEKLVKDLEKKEKEWIARLRNAQQVQSEAFEQLEGALHKDTSGGSPASSNNNGAAGTGRLGSRTNSNSKTSRLEDTGGGGGGVGTPERFGGASSYSQLEEGNSREDYGGEGPDDGGNPGDISGSMSEMNINHSSSQLLAEESLKKSRSSAASGISGLTKSSGGGSRSGTGGSGSGSSSGAGKKKVVKKASK
eukprot:CAMPEP_0174984554 /NCGR_PEP_ID=MMETSP0004_2-20121128/17794_1 /TAXON_ID=420556 /ORGANISM="Ochromonas sp., Strain CCMP1393" /LENGTH=380 /DNA_ID=CAMNT_0016236991 /DNA_START=38 /DNA_END=1180 /DNA_ORIENTATION=+